MEGARMPRQSAFRSEVVSAPARAAVYASAKNYSLGRSERKNAVRPQQGNARVWQEAIWDFYDIVPEYRFAVSWVGNLLSRATLLVHKDGVPTQETAAVEAMAGLFGGPEGQAEMLRLLGVHFTAVGEAFIVGIPEGGDHGDDWMIAAASEVTRSAGDNGVWKVGSDELPEDALVIRLWKPHPRKPKESDCPSRAVIPILSELNGLTQHVAAQIDSRLSGAGVLLLPSEMDLPARMQTRGSTVDGEEVAETSVQLSGPEAFAQVLSDTMGTSIGDRKSASRLVPVILQGPGEYLDRVRLVQFWSGLDEAARTLREEAIRRLSLGMDMPPEVLTGTADVNHWGAWADRGGRDQGAHRAAPGRDLRRHHGGLPAALPGGGERPGRGQLRHRAGHRAAADAAEPVQGGHRAVRPGRAQGRGDAPGERLRPGHRHDGPRRAHQLADRAEARHRADHPGHGRGGAARDLGVQIAAPADSSTPPAQERPVRSLDDHPRREPPDTQNQAAAASLDPLVSAAEVMVFRALERAGNRLKARFGTPIDIPAFKLYLSVPTLSRHECEELLTDAWSCVGQLGYGAPLEKALQEYTIGLLRLSKVHEREALGRHLALSFTAVTAA
jgi:hypothetical protein